MRRLLVWLLTLAMMVPCALGEAEWDVEGAVEALKACWRDEVYEGMAADGYLEVKNTRVVTVANAPKAEGEAAQAYADEYFGDVEYIVEFLLYVDLMGTAPYYQSAGAWSCVVVHTDGTMAVPAENPFDVYLAHTYILDLSGIVESVIDLNQDCNDVYHLLKE